MGKEISPENDPLFTINQSTLLELEEFHGREIAKQAILDITSEVIDAFFKIMDEMDQEGPGHG